MSRDDERLCKHYIEGCKKIITERNKHCVMPDLEH